VQQKARWWYSFIGRICKSDAPTSSREVAPATLPTRQPQSFRVGDREALLLCDTATFSELKDDGCYLVKELRVVLNTLRGQ